MPKISVIVPVYNIEKCLPKCLDSIINQTFKDIEIICVNDGSEDNSLSILEKYAKQDERIKIINKENAGLSSARNKGLDVAVGEFCYFVDSDDWIENDTLEICYNKMINNDVDAVVHLVKNIPEDKNCIELAKNSQIWIDNFSKHDGIYEVPVNISSELASTAWNKLYKTEIIEKYHCRFPEGLINEDEAFVWIYFIHCRNYFYVDKKLYNYLRRSISIMGQIGKNAHVLDLLKIQEIIYKTVKQYKNIDEYSSTLADLYINCVYSVLKRSGRYTKEVCELIKKYNEINQDKRFIKLYREVKYLYNLKKFVRKIFSIENSEDKEYKIITILGLRFLVKVH